MRVHQLPLESCNAHVVSGDQHVLVDTGADTSREALLHGLSSLGLGGQDLALIVVTHAHAGASGNAAWLQRTFHVPVAVHSADAPILASGVERPVSLRHPIVAAARWFTNIRFEPVSPDVVFGHTLSLIPFGVSGTLVHTPGHTIGSSSLVTQDGDAVVGDLLQGGWFGGRLFATRPVLPSFAEGPERTVRSLALLSRLGVQRVHPGAGSVLSMKAIREEIIDGVRWLPAGPAPARVRERRLRQHTANAR
jgi:hydroxyacylglutathione hydrolase